MKRDLCFNSEAAQMYGVDGAIMLHHLAFWVYKNKLNQKNEIDGHTWTWNSASALRAIFPFWKDNQIRRILTNLEKEGAIISAVHNRARWDRTKWYTITEKVQQFYQFQKSEHASTEIKTSKSKKQKMDIKKTSHQYQIVNTDSKQIKTHIVYPYENEEFKKIWILWKQDRSNRKIKKYTKVGEQAALKKLQDESGGDVNTAIKMIQNSIANGYQGIFAIKNNRKPNAAVQGFDKSKLLDHLEQTRNS